MREVDKQLDLSYQMWIKAFFLSFNNKKHKKKIKLEDNNYKSIMKKISKLVSPHSTRLRKRTNDLFFNYINL